MCSVSSRPRRNAYPLRGACRLVVALVAIWLSATAAAASRPPGAAPGEVPLLVETSWLQARLGDPRLRIIDMSSGRSEYSKGHLPGAIYLSVDETRATRPDGGSRLPTAEEAARIMSRLGIAPGAIVVIYDDVGGLNASRLFFLLEVWGHPSLALLDGGIHAWRRAGLPLTRDVPAVAPASYQPQLRPERVVSAEWVRDRLGQPGIVLLDARSPAEFSGRAVWSRHGGHIPGAVNLEWRHHLRSDYTFKPRPELLAMYQGLGVTPDKAVVTYCQSNHRAAHSYFVLRLLGYDRVAAYDGSWGEWGNRSDLPIAR
jgi:thiosulfate/3-mercaptopyruvate sulfurtransferase